MYKNITVLMIAILTLISLTYPVYSANNESSLNLTVHQLAKDFMSLSDRVDANEQNIDSMSDSIVEINESLENISESIESFQSDLSNLQENNSDLQTELNNIKEDLTDIEEDVQITNNEIALLKRQFGRGTFFGNIKYKGKEKHYVRYGLNIIEPKHVSLTKNTLSLGDYLVRLDFFIRNRNYEEKTEDGKPAFHPASQVQIYVPAHILKDYDETIVLSLQKPTFSQATVDFHLPLKTIQWKAKKAELTILTLTENMSRGLIELSLVDPNSTDKLDINLEYIAPLDINPFRIGHQS